LECWGGTPERLAHATGRYFSIVGIRSTSNEPALDGISQPFIDQPEIGILGFVARVQGERPQLLLQAKAEPGNVGGVQVAPTVQATESNFQQVHGGKPTPFLEYFRDTAGQGAEPLGDSLQSEQGTRFLGKYNRNCTVMIQGDGPPVDSSLLRWVDTQELFSHICDDFVVNTDARSVLVCADWCRIAPNRRPFERNRHGDPFADALYHSFHAPVLPQRTLAILAVLENARQTTRIVHRLVPLDQLDGWRWEEQALTSDDNRNLRVEGFRVAAPTREVPAWCQPLVHSPERADITLVCQLREGRMQFLFRAIAEIGLRERVQFGPTLQDEGLPQNPGIVAAQIAECARDPAICRERLACSHSDEGGRFFQTTARYRICELSEDVKLAELPNACWMSLADVKTLLPRKGLFNNEARSALLLLLYHL
jgi:oxidase EvaA